MTYETQITGEVLTGPTSVHRSIPLDPHGDDDLRGYFGALEDLGLECPSDEAVRWWKHVAELRALAHELQTQDRPGPAELARQLGRSEITVAQAMKRLPEVLTTSSPEYGRAQVRLMSEAKSIAIKACRQALREAGDSLLEGPRSVAEAVLPQDPITVDGEERYEKAQRLAFILRQMAVVPRAEGAKADEYVFTRPDLVAEWREEHGHRPTLADIGGHPEWGAGVFSATQAIAAAEGYATEPTDQAA